MLDFFAFLCSETLNFVNFHQVLLLFEVVTVVVSQDAVWDNDTTFGWECQPLSCRQLGLYNRV